MTILTRQFDGRFIGLGTRVTKKHVIHTAFFSQLVGKTFLIGNFIDIGRMQQFFALRTDGFVDCGVSVP